MKKMSLVAALIMSACGGGVEESDAPVEFVPVLADDFSGRYVGARSIEYRDDSGIRTHRRDHDFVVDVSRETDEVVVLRRVSVCDIWLDLESPVIPPQTCEAPGWNDGDSVPHMPKVSVTGTWRLVGEELTVSLEESHTINSPGERPTVASVRTAFSGMARVD